MQGQELPPLKPRMPDASRCPQCGLADLQNRHCKLLCANCGYVESCEDLFPTDRYCSPSTSDAAGEAGPTWRIGDSER